MISISRSVLDAHSLWLESSGREGKQFAFPNADLRGADLAGANLAHANLAGAKLDGAALAEANLEGASMTGSSLVGAHVQRARLRSVNFAGANLFGSDLHHADLRGARLVDAVLRQSWCITTRFDGADLTGADFSRAYLGKTSLPSAVLDGSVLTDVDANIVSIDGARFDVTKVSGLAGAIGPACDHVTVLGDGTPREVTVEELVAILGRHAAQVSTWGAEQRAPSMTPWRWDPYRAGADPERFNALRAQFTPDEIRLLEDNHTDPTEGPKQADALTLAFDWTTQVARIDDERTMSVHDRHVRTEHDLAGLLFTRDRAADALASLPDNLRTKVQQFLTIGDERFVGYTVEDPRARMAMVAGVDPAGRSWWWFRVPFDGPIVEFLKEWPPTSQPYRKED